MGRAEGKAGEAGLRPPSVPIPLRVTLALRMLTERGREKTSSGSACHPVASEMLSF